MRLAPLFTTIALSAAAVTACGGGSAGPAPAPVRLTIVAPTDLTTVHDDHVEVQGTVDDRFAPVADGRFDGRPRHVSCAIIANAIASLASTSTP